MHYKKKKRGRKHSFDIISTDWKNMMRYNKGFTVGFVILLVTIGLASVSFFSPYDPGFWYTVPKNLPPSWEHLLGTNSLGQDVFWILTFAIGNSLILGFFTAFVSGAVGTVVGLIAGYKRGMMDRLIMLVNDSFIILPTLPLLMMFAFTIKENLNMITMGLVLSIFSWSWGGRQVRSMVLSLREREFTYTAISSGMGTFKVIFREYFPFVFPFVMATFVNTVLYAIGMEITLAVFGLSTLEIPTIGTMIYWSVNRQAILKGFWWWWASPVVLSVLLFVSLFLVSSGINEYSDPRATSKYAKQKG